MAEIAQKKQSSFLLLILLVICVVAGLTTLAILLKKDAIENDLSQRANRLLVVSHLFNGKVIFEGRDALVEGSVAVEENKSKVLDIVRHVDGVRVVTGNIDIKPVPKDTASDDIVTSKKVEKPQPLEGRFTLRYDSGRWILVGETDSEATKENLVDSTREMIGDEINDSLLTVNPSKPRPRWISRYLQVLEPFSLVHGSAELTLNKGILTIGGDVDSETTMRMVLLPFREAFGNVVSIRNNLRIPVFKDGLYIPNKKYPIENIDLTKLKFNDENTELTSNEGLEGLVNELENNPNLYIEISGNFSLANDEDENTQISLQRALLVKKYLIEHGIAKARLRTMGFGSLRPIDKNDQARNQRIDVMVIREE